MTPEDEEAVEEAARRIVEISRRWEAGEVRQGAPSPTPLEILEEHTGGEFTSETTRLAERVLIRAQEIRGQETVEGVEPGRREGSRVEEFGGRRDRVSRRF